MEGWVDLVGSPIADTLPTKWSHVNHRSGEDQESQPAKDRRPNHWATPPSCYTSYTNVWYAPGTELTEGFSPTETFSGKKNYGVNTNGEYGARVYNRILGWSTRGGLGGHGQSPQKLKTFPLLMSNGSGKFAPKSSSKSDDRPPSFTPVKNSPDLRRSREQLPA